MPSWDDLRFVLEVARTTSVSAAAKKLGVAHTTVYRRIQAIEEAQNLTLFERRGARHQATRAGEAFAQVALEMEERLETLSRKLAVEEPRVEGDVHITMVAGFARGLVEPLGRLRRRHPGLRLHLSVTNDIVSLAKGEADIAIRVTRQPPERLVGRKMADVRFAVFGVTPSLGGQEALAESEIGHHERNEASRPQASGPRAFPPNLDHCSWVCLDNRRSETPQARWEEAHVPAGAVAFRTNDRTVFLDAVRAGIGVGVLPMGLAETIPELRLRSDPLEQLSLPLWILTHDALRNVPRVRVVLDVLTEVLADARDQF